MLRDDPGTAARLAGEALGRASRRSNARALELLAWSNLAAGNLRDARAARARLGPAAGSGRGHELLDGLLAVAAGEPAAGVGAAFVRCEDPVTLAVAARLLLQAGRLDEALTDVPGDAAAAVLETAQLVLHQAGLFQAAAEVGERLFARRPAPGVAYNVARGYSAAGDGDAALAWLDRAVAHGFRDLGQLDTHPDLAAVRATDRFRHLRASLR